jgi:hypothetical protein
MRRRRRRGLAPGVWDYRLVRWSPPLRSSRRVGSHVPERRYDDGWWRSSGRLSRRRTLQAACRRGLRTLAARAQQVTASPAKTSARQTALIARLTSQQVRRQEPHMGPLDGRARRGRVVCWRRWRHAKQVISVERGRRQETNADLLPLCVSTGKEHRHRRAAVRFRSDGERRVKQLAKTLHDREPNALASLLVQGTGIGSRHCMGGGRIGRLGRRFHLFASSVASSSAPTSGAPGPAWNPGPVSCTRSFQRLASPARLSPQVTVTPLAPGKKRYESLKLLRAHQYTAGQLALSAVVKPSAARGVVSEPGSHSAEGHRLRPVHGFA